MWPYVLLNIFIVIFGLYFEHYNSLAKKRNINKRLPNYFFTIPSFIMFFVFFAFRGDFTADYDSYIDLFNLYNVIGFPDVFQLEFNQEPGYILLNLIVGFFTTNYIYLYAVVALLTLLGFYYQFNKYSVYIWLSVLMLVTIGPFYTSFNLLRQILAVAITFAGSKYLYERKMWKFFLVVLIASSFHQTALIMIPFYFILNMQLKKINLMLIAGVSAFAILFLNQIIDFIQLFFYTRYDESSYGMTGQGFANAALPIAFLIFTAIYHKKINVKNTIERIWVNSLFYYALFNILSLQIQMVDRVGHYFTPYALLLIPLIFSRVQPKELRFLYLLFFVILLILTRYYILVGSEYDPYYFIWDA